MSNPQKNLADIVRTIADQVRAVVDGVSGDLFTEVRALYESVLRAVPHETAEQWARADGQHAYVLTLQSLASCVEHDFGAWKDRNPYATQGQAREALEEIIGSAVDGACIYTADALDVIRWCADHDAYDDAYGEPPVDVTRIDWPAVAACALDQDLRDRLDVESMLAEETEETEEA